MAQCLTPFSVKDVMKNATIPVPCGKCPHCLARRASGWSFRLMQEDKRSISAFFLTLTYDTKNVPISKRGFMNLCKRDVQLFLKRLRNCYRESYQDEHTGKRKYRYLRNLKYYAVGEYGTDNWRPHYHLILFNADIQDIQPSWDLGHVHYGSVTHASVGYTLKYMMKPPRIPLHQNDDRIKEFSLMSKGLGANYLSPAMIKWHMDDLLDRVYCAIEDGKKISMPRYYKNKLYNEMQRERIAYFGKIAALRAAFEREMEMEKRHGGDAVKVQVEIDSQKFVKMKKDSLKNRNL